ncbi:sfi1 spindle body domain protein [Rhodotorula toruloides]|uniref:Sfi1 spindle body domain protein n=1 Tax=Rhodotorula toruloides TaxID=5286 RepID=A0A511KHB1_RHOTO|nr:sfi1 spindle body domain protein [Rhodotorula toruloides]
MGTARRAVGKWVRRVGEVRHRVRVMEEVADEKWNEAEMGRKREMRGWWVQRTALKVKEAELVRAREDALRREGWEWWREMKQRRDHVRHLEQVASSHDARHLAVQALTVWRTRTTHLSSLSSLASTHAHALLARRASSHLTHWRLSLRLRLALRVRTDSLLSTSLSTWLDTYEHIQIELEGRADALIATRGARVAVVALEAWRSAVQHRGKLQRAAETYSRLRYLASGLARWKGRWEEERVREKKAEVVRDFFVTRRAWRRWSEESWERKRARWELERSRKQAKETLDYWLAQLRQRRRDRELVTHLQRQQGQRLRAASMEQWKLAVVVRKEDEVEARDWRDHKLVRAGFRRWAGQTVKAEERILRAASFRTVKLEELRDRLFHAWLSSSRRSATLRERLVRFDAARKRKTLEASFDCWREGSLRGTEEQVQRRRMQRERQSAWEWWKCRTKTLAAIQHHNRLLAWHALSAWQAWTPSAVHTRRAVAADEGSVIGGAFQVWKIKTGAKKALRSYKCADAAAGPTFTY